jgi:hypothetical protein
VTDLPAFLAERPESDAYGMVDQPGSNWALDFDHSLAPATALFEDMFEFVKGDIWTNFVDDLYEHMEGRFRRDRPRVCDCQCGFDF